jgi:hypothetical protein
VGDLNVEAFDVNLWRPLHLADSWVVVYRLYAFFPSCAVRPYDGCRSPDGWWTIYNGLKHNRLDNYQSADLINTLKSLGALFLLLVRHQEEAFTKALVRRGWIKSSVVPEFIHSQRSGGGMFIPPWIDTELFGVHENYNTIPSQNITQIPPYMASVKFQKFLGRFNPEPQEPTAT